MPSYQSKLPAGGWRDKDGVYKNQADYNAQHGAVGGAVKAAPKPTAAAPMAQSAPATNTAAMDPTVANQLAEYQKRLGSDPSKRAIQDSTLGIQDAAALSAADAKGILSRRGTLGSGAGDTFLQRKVFDPAQRQAAGAAAQIAQNEEARKDALVLGGTGLAALPGNQAVANKNINLNTQGQAWNQAFQTQQAQWQQDQAKQQAQAQADQQALENALRAAQMSGVQPGAIAGAAPAGVPVGGGLPSGFRGIGW